MYIRETFDKRVNKKYLFVSETYRDIENKSKIRNLKNFGLITNNNKNELINLANEYIAKNKEHKDKTLLIDFNENANSNHADFNYGFIILEKIFNILNIDNFIYKNIKKRSDAFDLNSTIKLLVYSRILNPDSKLETFNGKDGFFGNPFKDIKLDNIYDSLTDLFKVENSLQLHIHKEVSKLYDRKMEMVFYDVTNYFFETDYDDGYDENGKPLGLRYSGVSKENRETPIVQMGLLMDSQGIPIAYKLFQGNTHDQKTLVPILEEFKTTFNLKSITVVADKGLNSGANIDYLIKNNHKFIVSQMIRSKDEKFRTEILKDNYK
jgi:hypothetical protein